MDKFGKEYDRMNPNVYELLKRLEEYAAKDYGVDTYPLSKAEATRLLGEIEYLEGALGDD